MRNILFFGRFQIIHNGHLNDLIHEIFRRKGFDKVYIGITGVTDDLIDRNNIGNNPLSFQERKNLLNIVVNHYYKNKNYDIIPFNISSVGSIQKSIKGIKGYLKIIIRKDLDDIWSQIKIDRFIKLGGRIDIEILTNKSRLTSGTEIRDMIRNGGNWKKLVPDCIHTTLESLISKIK